GLEHPPAPGPGVPPLRSLPPSPAGSGGGARGCVLPPPRPAAPPPPGGPPRAPWGPGRPAPLRPRGSLP
ncbi:response regulator, partial [Campylobacter coli]|nr:response regulator [Campylobacter coli]